MSHFLTLAISPEVYLGLRDPNDYFVDHVYFGWSVVHLCLRALAVGATSVRIHEAGLRPLKHIQKLSCAHYDKEVGIFGL